MRFKRPCLVFLSVFVVSRVAVDLAGLRYSTEHVTAMMHFVDIEWLHDRLGETLLFQHGQPPLMTVLMGILVKIFGDGYPTAMLLLLLGAGSAGIRVLRRPGAADPNDIVLVFLAFTVVWVFALGVLLDTGETNRYRLSVDALMLVGAMITVRDAARWLRRRSGRRTSPATLRPSGAPRPERRDPGAPSDRPPGR